MDIDIDIIGFKNYIKEHGRKSYVGYNTYYTITNDEYGVECVLIKKEVLLLYQRVTMLKCLN